MTLAAQIADLTLSTVKNCRLSRSLVPYDGASVQGCQRVPDRQWFDDSLDDDSIFDVTSRSAAVVERREGHSLIFNLVDRFLRHAPVVIHGQFRTWFYGKLVCRIGR